MPDHPPPDATLRRSLGTATLTIYGIGTIVGAGIFVLLGRLIGIAGEAAPHAFLLATVIGMLTGLSYARLAARIPQSAGEAAYVQQAFGHPSLTLAVGLAVAGSGILSAATIAHGFAAYLDVLLPSPAAPVAAIYLVLLGLVAIAGIRETAWLVGLIAVGSTLGLIAVAGLIVQADADWHWPSLAPELSGTTLTGIVMGAFLAFYALIGFEDLVNLAEEVERPGHALSIAIPVALGFAALLYIALCIVALGAAPVEVLAASDAPMALLLDQAGIDGRLGIVVLSAVAITEGALAQLVMASRVLYGLGRQGRMPSWLSRIHQRTRTPVNATLVVIALGVAATLSGGVLSLARGTSLLVLSIFAVVNVALLRLYLREGRRRWQLWLPLLATASCVLLIAGELLRLSGVITLN